MEMEISVTEDQFRSLFENSIDAVLLATPDGTVMAANAEACRIFGHTEEEICRLGRTGLIDPTDPRLPALLQERARTGRFKGELTFIRKDGVKFPGEVSSAFYKDKSGAMKASVIIRDVTERKRAEVELRQAHDELETRVQARTSELSEANRLLTREIDERRRMEEARRESEERFRRLFEHAGDAFFVVNVDGKLLNVNQAACESVGYTRDELLAKEVKDLNENWNAERIGGLLQQLITGATVTFEAFHRRKDGSVFPIEIHAALLESGNQPSLLAVARDITERKNTEIKLQAAKEAAEAANRAKSEFLARMSHELRTPLNSILGYAQIFRRDQSLNESQQEGAAIIQKSGEHLLGLINEVLDLAKIESKQMELRVTEFNLPELLKSVVEMARVRAEQKGLAFVYETRSTLPAVVRGDAQRLRQVLINLLGNAIKFTAQGSVSLKVGYHETAPDKTQIRFQVEDTGVGIAPENWESIFLPFHQAGDARDFVEGTGLGLTISREFVRMMGGELQLQSAPGAGSVFWLALDLPAVAEGATTATLSPHHLLGYEGARRKILVVDDKTENRAVILHLLAPLGFEMHEAGDGRDGLEKTMALRPDLILMDLVMPLMDGFEATRRIRQQSALANIPVIALSASVFEHNRQQSLDAGCNDFLPKPIQAENLLEALRQQLKLEWIYSEVKMPEEKKSDLPLIGPPATEATALMDLAMRGDIKDLLQRVESLEQRGEEFKPLTGELRRLAKEYRMKEIRELVQRFILSR